MDEDDTPRKPSAHEVGMILDALSVQELEERLVLLEKEIERLKEEIARKTSSRSAADSAFKF